MPACLTDKLSRCGLEKTNSRAAKESRKNCDAFTKEALKNNTCACRRAAWWAPVFSEREAGVAQHGPTLPCPTAPLLSPHCTPRHLLFGSVAFHILFKLKISRLLIFHGVYQ
ncbi:hypothetical protein E2C01_080557 [Portunus trituberculatus]|uniref:Uncharacterized protein n=1 Tax=Portunus trituberculatus TaxID=210409 RepID=A0A5B7ITK6_PORTR|nr:hypothetical protein [Portunus trituberculatus]